MNGNHVHFSVIRLLGVRIRIAINRNIPAMHLEEFMCAHAHIFSKLNTLPAQPHTFHATGFGNANPVTPNSTQ